MFTTKRRLLERVRTRGPTKKINKTKNVCVCEHPSSFSVPSFLCLFVFAGGFLLLLLLFLMATIRLCCSYVLSPFCGCSPCFLSCRCCWCWWSKKKSAQTKKNQRRMNALERRERASVARVQVPPNVHHWWGVAQLSFSLFCVVPWKEARFRRRVMLCPRHFHVHTPLSEETLFRATKKKKPQRIRKTTRSTTQRYQTQYTRRKKNRHHFCESTTNGGTLRRGKKRSFPLRIDGKGCTATISHVSCSPSRFLRSLPTFSSFSDFLATMGDNIASDGEPSPQLVLCDHQ